MKKLAALLAAIAVGTGVSVKMTLAQPPARTESSKEAAKPENVGQEDPLPAGSVMRLGTTRFRNGIPVSDLVISADGKMAVAVNGNHMLGATRVFDMVSGRVLYTLG